MLCQRADVHAALAQGGHRDGIDIEPIIEVLTEGALAHHGGQIPIGGRDDADVHLDGGHPAHPYNLFFLYNPQQLGLKRQRQFAHLVQKQRPALGRLP